VTDLTTRTYTPDDAADVCDLLNTIDLAEGAEPGFTEGEIRSMFAAIVRDAERDSRIVRDGDGTLVAFGAVSAPPPDGQRFDLLGGVHPDWRGCGIGRDLLGWQLDRGVQMYAERSPEKPWQAEAGTYVTDKPAIKLFERFGMAPVRYFFEMKAPLSGADIPSMTIPDGLRLVEYADEMRQALYDAHMEAFADHWGFQKRPFEEWCTLAVANETFRADFSRVVFDGDEIAAYLLGYDGVESSLYIGQVGTRRPWRKRGLASAMLADVLAAAVADGRPKASLGVDAESPTGAVGVYERVGFHVESRFVAYRRPIPAP
jgi:ribosomal protein S18 acetylase RimI-like enzyme